MKILRVIATLDPRQGGPAAGLYAITPALAALGHVTTIASMDSPQAAAEFPLEARCHGLGPAFSGYAYAFRLKSWLRAHAGDHDAVFVHGLWQYHGRAVRAALHGQRTPYFVFPHGMLDPWFRQAYPRKHLKKWVYWQLCERFVLRDAAAVLFTCEEERRLARRTFEPYICRERVVTYGTSAPSGDPAVQRAAWRQILPGLGARPFWLYLGRIHPKKGIDLLLRAYGQLARESKGPLPALVLAGPCGNPRYSRLLEAIAAGLPPACTVAWTGMLEGDEKWGALRSAEALILPSHQENFGLVVVEALAVGTPVLISRQVNIWEEIAAAGAGLAEDDDLDGVLRLLRRWHTFSTGKKEHLRKAASAVFQERYEITRVAQSLVATVSPFLSPSTPHESASPARCTPAPGRAPA